MQSAIVPLTNGGVTLVDEIDLPEVMKRRWHKVLRCNIFYAVESSTKTYLHRFIMKAKKGQMIDHISRDGLDNRRCNLRFCTRSQNNRNSSIRKDNSSGYKGVSFDRDRKKCWVAKICFNGVEYWLGSFYSKIEAAFAYDAKAIELFGRFAWLNFPKSIDLSTALEKIKNSQGRIIKVAFNKRTDNSERVMLCRVGVKKGIMGKGLCYNPDDYNMIVVYDMKKRSYRMISMENLKALWIDKQKYKVA